MPLLGLHESARGLAEALDWLEQNCKTRHLDQAVVREYHRMAMQQKESAYRTKGVYLVGSSIQRPSPDRIPILMKQFELQILRAQEDCDGREDNERDVLGCAVRVHERIGMIHPFEDGNGRVARLAMNHILRRYTDTYVILPPLSESPELMAALQNAHRGNPDALVALAKSCLVSV